MRNNMKITEQIIRRCEVCGKVYDDNESNGYINLDSSRPNNTERYRSGDHTHLEYHTCVDCHDKLIKTITDMIHGDK